MKKTFFSIVLLICTSIVFGQTLNMPNNPSFYDGINAFKNSNIAEDSTSEGGSMKFVNRLEKIWASRLFPHNGNPNEVAQILVNYNKQYPYSYTSKSNPNWINLGPNQDPTTSYDEGSKGIGQIHRIAFHPQFGLNGNQTMYASSSFGGLWKSTTGGNSWEMFHTDLLPSTSVSDIAVSHFYPDEDLYICTGDADGGFEAYYEPNSWHINPLFTHGVYRWKVNEWVPMNSGLESLIANSNTCRQIVTSPYNKDIVFLLTSDGIYKTSNSTSPNPTWTKVYSGADPYFTGQPDPEFRGFEFKPGSQTTIYASGKDIYKSTDGGSSWSSMTNGLSSLNLASNLTVLRINIATTSLNSNYLWAYIICNEAVPIPGQNNGNGKKVLIYKYDGINWIQKASHVNWYFGPNGIFSTDGSEEVASTWNAIAASPTEELIYFGHVPLRKYSDITNSLTTIDHNCSTGDILHADIHEIAFAPNSNGNVIYLGTDGGVSKVSYDINTGYSIENKYDEMSVATIWAMDNIEQKDNYIIGNQDNGTMYGNSAWHHVIGGDGYTARNFHGKMESMVNSNTFDATHEIDIQTYSYESFPLPDIINPQLDPGNRIFTYAPHTYPIVQIPNESDPYFGFSEIYKKIKKNIEPGDTWQDHWQLMSDLYLSEPVAKNRQILDIVFGEDDPNIIYVMTMGLVGSTGQYYITPKLYKSTTGFAPGSNGKIFNQIDYPGQNATLDYHPVITSITTNPSNDNELWLSYTGFNQDYKVFFYNTSTNQFENGDPNHTLPPVPVNNIVFQKGSTGTLYAATDRGVYIKDQQNNWTKYGADFPNVRVTELDIDYYNNKLIAATFGRGLWVGDLVSNDYNYRTEITEDIVWDWDKIINHTVVVNAGATLTIKSKVMFSEDSKLIVKQGAHLILDGAILTSQSGKKWKGIEVWGNEGLEQLPISNQGWLSSTDSEINNAEIAIRTYKVLESGRGSIDFRSTGGVINLSTTSFYDNDLAIKMIDYKFDSKSTIIDCEFHNRECNNIDAYGFIELSGINYVTLNGNLYKYYPNLNGTNEEFIGIRTFNASTNIGGIRQGETTFQNNTFMNLGYGIYATASNSIPRLDARHCDFDATLKGIFMSGVSNSRITSNNFEIPFDNNTADTLYGLYMENCDAYHVEANHFSGLSTSEKGDCGLYIYSTVPTGNEIYNNEFEYLTDGIIAQGQNRVGTSEGLCIKCNDFLYNTTDISVVPLLDANGNPYSINTNTGIAYAQGSSYAYNAGDPTALAGNTFSHSSGPIFNDLNAQHFIYHHHQLGNGYIVKPEPSTNFVSQHVNGSLYSKSTACPSNIENNGGGTTPHDERSKIDEANNSINEYTIEFNELTDGGNTEELNNTVQSSFPDEGYEVHQELMSDSPYLSDKVIASSIEREDMLADVMIRDIMVNNPHSSKSNTLLEQLDNRTEPIPDYMWNEILEGQDIIGSKEEIQLNLSKNYNSREQSYGNIVRYFNNDTNRNHRIDSLKSVYEEKDRLIDKFKLAMLMQNNEEYNAAIDLISELDENNYVNEDEVESYNQFMIFFNQVNGFMMDSISLSDLNENELSQIQTLSEYNCLSATYAKNILRENYHRKCEEHFFNGNINKNQINNIWGSRTIKFDHKSNNLIVSPNPATDFCTFEYTISNEMATIKIANLQGKVIDCIYINGKRNKVIYSVEILEKGSYIVSLYSKNQLVESKKLTIL
jgi:hypothetical protein